MDQWQADLAATINRALGAAVDVAVYKETGVKQGAIWVPNNAQPSQLLTPGAAPAPAGLREYLPALLIGGAVLLVVWRLAK